MALYALTLQPPSTCQLAITGDFIGMGSKTKEEHILTACGSRLTIIHVDRAGATMREIFAQDMFATIRRIEKFRIQGGTKGT